MPIGRGGADAGGAGSIRKGEPGGPLFRDQIEGGLDQCLAKVAMVIAPASKRSLSRPAHVNEFYIKSTPQRRRDLRRAAPGSHRLRGGLRERIRAEINTASAGARAGSIGLPEYARSMHIPLKHGRPSGRNDGPPSAKAPPHRIVWRIGGESTALREAGEPSTARFLVHCGEVGE
jgi:hypothetical protein